jgi:hemolysin III
MVSYIVMGWAVVISVKDIIANMPRGGLIFLLLGGIAYTVGIIFYALKKVKFMHSVWHFFVLAGSILQFFAVYFYVLPTR